MRLKQGGAVFDYGIRMMIGVFVTVWNLVSGSSFQRLVEQNSTNFKPRCAELLKAMPDKRRSTHIYYSNGQVMASNDLRLHKVA